MLPFSLIELPRDAETLPLYPYSVGRHIQFHHVRPAGFPVHQIFLIRTGTGLFRDLESGTEIILEPGMAFAFPPDRGHEYYPTSHEPWHVGFIGIEGIQSQGLLEGIGLLPSIPYHPARFEQCWEEIGKIWHTVNNQTASRQDAHGMEDLSITLYRLLLMLRRSESTHTSGSRLELESVRNGALAKAVGLINEHYTEPLLISNLAAAVGYSVQHFQRLFVHEYGITPHKYLQNLRLERAVQLMTENDEILVQDIALQLGMETNYFIRIFRNTYGCTPGVMKERLLEGNK
ncbi:AraC family transcriptional regulator [Paenibacillus odorifer]|uniref:AraC family transcriptional regulator n=1 Tax=Paenibacillus odorifer TaxID=189426 RepID=A0A1R0XZE7_9BACL|nr:AraC family transcriptional regulator [Paenibacillus odorifer]OMD40478.1 AraC family transcriptional regulator [Paenibacillus odorifer]